MLVGRDRGGVALGLVPEALRAQADRQALEHERRQGRTPAVADTADDSLRAEPHIIEEDLVELRLARDLAQAADRDPLGIHRDDEHRQALVLGHVGVGPREQQPVRGEMRIRRPHLLP